ncbi:MAG TPA: peroxiredoxin [Pyrinomonadaceae bacterium]|nr:peroxiredoxin [Pyrinomonadaceae bacterium]
MKIGENAPDFTLKDGDGRDWKLAEHLAKTVVLMFYPGDNTPVCTKQMCSVRDNWAQFRGTGAEIVGISTDSAASHKNFAAKNNFPFTLLSDEAGEVITKYGVKSWIPGRAARAIVVIDRKGKIAYHKAQSISLFRPDDAETLAAIRRARGV